MTYFPVLSEAYGFGAGIGEEMARLFNQFVLGMSDEENFATHPYADVFTEAPATVSARDSTLLLAGLVVVGIYLWKGGKLQ